MGRLKLPTWGNAPHPCNSSIASVICLIISLCYVNKVSALVPEPCHSSSCNSSSSSIKNVQQFSSSSRIRTRSVTPNEEVLKYSYRLFKNIVPEKYFLTISPILQPGFESSLGEQWKAPGHVLISVHAEKAAKSITLHAKNITIHNVTVTHNKTGEPVPVKDISYNVKHSYMTIHLSSSLVPGDTYDISIAFTSYVSEVLNGLFRSSYKNEETGETEWFAATHMEALHARQMYPCFDEPSFKATIQAKVGRHQDYVSLFNTESIRNETMDGVEGWVWETFAPTVPMSSYLTALVIAKFQYSEAPEKLLPDTRVRTYAPAHFVQQGATQYSADVAERVLYTYGEYFNQKYPMKKFDSVAVPSFLYGAMENFGLSIFRETLLLNFENQTTESMRYTVTNVICHELGHQWFGNLVSPDWWTHLWLSEGLTKFTEYIGLNATLPEFQPWDIFISESLQTGLRLDGDSRTSHSLKIDEDAWLMKSEMEWFDDIAYKKGGALIRMMQGFLSEPVLRKGLARYLSRLKYKSAIQDDLFSDCEKEGRFADKLPANTTLKEIMSGWTLQSGFPLLRVEHVPGTNNITVSQEKYSGSRTERDLASSKKAKWFIPVSIATAKNPSFDPEPEFWIRSNEKTVAITLPSRSWIVLNAGTTGFYRVIYDEDLTRRITDQLMASPLKIDRYSRSQLMDDYFNAAFNRYIPIHRALNLTRYMKDHAETEHVVWTPLLSMLKTGFRLFKDAPEDFDAFKGYLLPRIERAIHETGGFSAINMSSKGLPVVRHAQLLDWACNLESKGCIDYSTDLVKSWNMTGILTAPRDFRVVVLSAAVANDPKGDIFDFIMDKYKTTNYTSPDTIKLKDQMLTALSTTRNHPKIKLLLDSIFQPDQQYNDEDVVTLLQHLASNVAASDTILKYFVENFQTIIDRFGSTAPITAVGNAMAPHLKSLSGLFLVEELVKTDEKLFKTSLAPVINRIRANIMWYDDFGESMLDFFDQNK